MCIAVSKDVNAYAMTSMAGCVSDRCSAFQLCTKPSSSISSTFRPVGDVSAVEYFLSSDTRSLEIVNHSKCHIPVDKSMQSVLDYI